jgi:predicted RNA-binding Zn-ribbon protein involved in translation (DUF1610 family)
MAEDCEGDNPPNDNEDIKPSKSVKTGSSNKDGQKVKVPSERSDGGNSKQKVVVLTSGSAHEVIEEFSEEILYEYECPSCGCGVSEEMTKCPACDAEFIVEEEEEKYECPSCRASVTTDMTKCLRCDTEFVFEEEDEEIAEYECPICGAYVTSSMTNCPICEVYLPSYIKFD